MRITCIALLAASLGLACAALRGGAPTTDAAGSDARADGPKPSGDARVDGTRPDAASDGSVADAVADGLGTSEAWRPEQGSDADVFCAACPLGCNATKTRCKVLVPATLSLQEALTLDLLATGDCDLKPNVDTTYSVNTSARTFPGCPAATTWFFPQSGGPPVTVFAFNTLRIGTHAHLRIASTAAAMFYVRRELTVEGSIDASAEGHLGGPGGKSGAVNAAGQCWFNGGAGSKGSHINASDSGGGGGAWGTDGAAGGTSGNAVAGGGGTAQGVGAFKPPLHGGCSGGAGGGGVDAGRGGGGGGALHLVAGRTLTINGVVNAGGGGGGGGSNEQAGGGAGSGGTILLEAQTVVLGGVLAANGGGGGAGAGQGSGASSGLPGEAGRPSTTAAAGGVSVANESGQGGVGAALANDAAPGQSRENAGGGGGGVGRIDVRGMSISFGGVRSPTATSDGLVSIQ